ncbi:hypothetical protein M3S04_03970 [Xanthomonas sp. PPL139]|uniref:hypothetical protein n=1 Tax=unclassified Xanthomonas TaxID=2643310 RepID=UPI0033BED283
MSQTGSEYVDVLHGMGMPALQLVRATAWYAFVRAAQESAPISPTPTLSRLLLEELARAGVLKPTASAPNVLDPWGWHYADTVGDTSDLSAHLLVIINSIATQPAADVARLWLWRQLIDAESEAHMADLLARHQLGALRALITHVHPHWQDHSLCRRRYLGWYAVRGAAAAFLRTDGDDQMTALTLLGELRRRSQWLAHQFHQHAVGPAQYCFPPSPTARQSLLSQVFLKHIAPLGRAYWREVPSLQILNTSAWDSDRQSADE